MGDPEFLADLTASHDAWSASCPAHRCVEGPTGEQQFFLGYAQADAGKARDAALRAQVVTDPHSPGEYRADEVRNLDAWYAAFSVKPAETLYLSHEQHVRIW